MDITSFNQSKIACVLIITSVFLLGTSQAHAAAQDFTADIGDFIWPTPTGSTATAVGTFSLNAAMDELTYSITFFGLDLKELPADRTSSNDITAIHFHVGGPTQIGPHALNVFGDTLGAIHEDDDDLVIDYDTETVSGIWDDSDMSVGLAPGPASDPLTGLIGVLLAGGIYVNVHTVDFTSGEIRGQISAVPVPGAMLLMFSGLAAAASVSRKRG